MTRIARIVFAVAVTAGTAHLSGVARAQADFEGIWVPDHPPRLGQPLLSEVKLTPAGRAEFERFSPENDPSFRCIMPGVPRGLADPYPIEIVQQDHQILMLHEYYHQVRRVFMDGREAPDYWPPSLNGFSTGHWEGDTLVVRTTHLSPDNYMSISGLPFSGDEHTLTIEHYTRSADILSFTAEVHDPTNYEEAYVTTGRWNLAPDGEIWEYACNPEFGDVN
jgi:hypothetical protein